MSIAYILPWLVMSAAMPVPDMDTVGALKATEIQAQVASESRPQGQWLHSYTEARKLAQETGLPLVLHFEAKWCGPCRRMESEVLNRKEVLQLLGTHAIGVRIDSDRDRALVSEYGVTTLPTEVIVLPDGKRAGRHVGAVGLTSYTSRLRKLGSQSDSQNDAIQVASHETEITDAQEVTRTCLIVKHDGEMVGMGGYSPVALTTRKEWVKGSEEFVVQHEGVDYFLESAAEAELFSENPTEYIPRMHGCDVVELSRENRALAGSIEFGSFYRGQVFFFANRENRSRFQSHPAWYVDAMTNGQTTNGEQFPFLQTASFD